MNRKSFMLSVFLVVLLVAGCGGSGGGGGTSDPGTDVTRPSVPAGLLSSPVSTTEIALSWTASTDDRAVTGYKIYRDDSYIASVAGTTGLDSGLTASTGYCYTVSAYDAANNESSQCSRICTATLHTGFGTNGTVVTNVTPSTSQIRGIAIQSDGKIVAAGRADTPDTDFAVVRYLGDGTLDPNFGTGGKTTTNVGTGGAETDWALAVALDSNGRIVAAGEADTVSTQDFAVVRYGVDGRVDTSFGGGDGIVTTDLQNDTDTVWAVAIQTDGRIVAAGDTFISGTGDRLSLVRYNADGSLDTSFGTGGKVVNTGMIIYGHAMKIQSDGKIVVVGQGWNAGAVEYQLAVVRYNSNGTLDTGFNGTGLVLVDIGTKSNGMAIALQPDGKIIAAGSAQIGIGNDDFLVTRLTTTGSLDTAFNAGGFIPGIVTTAAGTATTDRAYAVALQADRKIVAAGTCAGDFALIRYNPDGSLDTDADSTSSTWFGAAKNGIVTTSLGANTDEIWSMAIQSDGKIVAAGFSNDGIYNHFAVARYLSDGSLDVPY